MSATDIHTFLQVSVALGLITLGLATCMAVGESLGRALDDHTCTLPTPRWDQHRLHDEPDTS